MAKVINIGYGLGANVRPNSNSSIPGFQMMSGTGGGSNLTGSAYDYSAAYGGKPNVPNPVSTAGQAISGNIGNLPALGNLATGIDTSNTQNLSAALAAMIPDYAGLTGQRSTDIGSELSGQLPADVISQLQQAGAERGAATGTSGSPNAAAAYLRALGLNSLQMEQQGMGNLAQAVTTTPLPKMFDPSSMLVSPEQQQSAAMAANMYASAPDPQSAAMAAMSAGQIPNAPQQGTNYPSINPGPASSGSKDGSQPGTALPGGAMTALPNSSSSYNGIIGPVGALNPQDSTNNIQNTPYWNLDANGNIIYPGGGQIPSTDSTGTTGGTAQTQQTGQIPDYYSQVFGSSTDGFSGTGAGGDW